MASLSQESSEEDSVPVLPTDLASFLKITLNIRELELEIEMNDINTKKIIEIL